ncbi:unnamed protein product [Vicia faba]|uniref:CRC domain-containing protein n=1 Tax=Vicia faba TaxID=3906 RepID=A0AAV1A807_VICFA|nr:unnamed protein product [Vicia faba]
MKAPPPLPKENEALHKYVGASLNSLAFDSSPPSSFDDVLSSYLTLYDESIVPIRNHPLDTSMLGVLSDDANKIHSHQEADKVIPTKYSYVQDGSRKDSFEGGNHIQEVGQIEANIEVPDCDGKNITSEMQSLTLMDRNPIERWNDEVARIRRGMQGLVLDRLGNRMITTTTNIRSYTAKSDERKNASNKMCGSTHIIPFQDLTNKQLKPPNLKRKRTCQIDLDASCLTNENQEESADFYKSVLKKKMKCHKEEGPCNNCKCIKSKCLKLYCECFAAGVYCTGPCSCQNCLNKHINKDKVLEAREKIVPKVEDPNKSGCNCNKSSCMKKYCECFKAGVGCSPSCNCCGCENIHGRKDRL